MKFSKAQANLIQGVSQQTDFMRDVSQCEEQINMIPDAVEGLSKRLGTEFKARLPDDITADAKFHFINRSDTEKYVIVVDRNRTETDVEPRLRVFDEAGQLQTVNYSVGEKDDEGNVIVEPLTPDKLEYLGFIDFKDNLVLRTVADTTFIVNKNTTCQLVKTPEKYLAGQNPDGSGNAPLPLYRRDVTIRLNLVDGMPHKHKDVGGTGGWSLKDYWTFTHNEVELFDEVMPEDSFDSSVEAHPYFSNDVFPRIITSLTSHLRRVTDYTIESDNITYVKIKAYPFGKPLPITSFTWERIGTGSSSHNSRDEREVDGVVNIFDNPEVIIGYEYPDTDDLPAEDGEVTESTPTPITDKYALIFFKQGDYETDYQCEFKIAENDEDSFTNLFDFTTPKTDRGSLNTTALAETTYKILKGEELPNEGTDDTDFNVKDRNLAHGFEVRLQDNVLLIWRTDRKDFTIRASDGLGGNGLKAIKGKTSKMSDLPEQGMEDFRVKIEGLTENTSDDYYVLYTQDGLGNEDGAGAWTETTGGRSAYAPYAPSMPHKLISKGGYFTFEAIDWKPRDAGDKWSNPDPSFIGNKINDLFFYSNRLCLLTNDTVVFSRANDYYNYFRKTVRTYLVDDVIDIMPDSDRVTFFQSAATFQGNLYLLSDNIQFKLTNQGALTADTLTVKPMSYYQLSNKAEAVSSGQLMYLPEKRMSHTAIREYFVDTANELEDATDATEHVPSYLKGQADKMALSIGTNTLLVATVSDPTVLYCHRFIWKGTKKVQAAWSTLDFGAPILALFERDNQFLIVIERQGKLHIETFSPEAFSTAEGVKHPVHVDSYEFIPQGQAMRQSAEAALTAFDRHGNKYELQHQGDEVFDSDGKARFDVTVGYPFTASYKLTKLRLKGQDEMPLISGRTQLYNLFVEYRDSGAFQVNVDALGRSGLTYTQDSKVLGKAFVSADESNTHSGVSKVPVRANAEHTEITLQSLDSLPLHVEAVEWEGITKKGQRRHA